MNCEEVLVFAVCFGENRELYFEEVLECDSLRKEQCICHQIFRNINSQILVVRSDSNVGVFESVADQEVKRGSGMLFTIHYYADMGVPETGPAVAFSVQEGSKTYSMYCMDEGGKRMVRFREGEPPKDIEGKSDIVFIQKLFTPGDGTSFKFESWLMPGYFLAFAEEGSLIKLILKSCVSGDEVDETMKIHFET
ncbi:PREDICTED: interleukin-18 [Crocodylus porosus]|uniref:Interleukin 18 n=1 Tax=Crocodylus porosus TaxID=8502 RepID=A0A7M4EAJ3_CROPO|nr:PREDICTED: interleukin-18 [Crocodylus porosus]XP_019402670.1 PREDICTED: interleukin-18 [Crocodylus porosus]